MSAPSAVSRAAVSTTTRRRSSPCSLPPSSPNESGSRNSARSASRHAAATSATSRSWSAGVRRVRVVVDEQLGRGRPQALHLLDAPARQHAAHARARRALVPGRLHRHDEPRAAGQRAVRDRGADADLRVEQHARPGATQLAHDGALEVDHLGLGHRGRVVGAQLLAQVLPVVERQHGERAPRAAARVQPAQRARGGRPSPRWYGAARIPRATDLRSDPAHIAQVRCAH